MKFLKQKLEYVIICKETIVAYMSLGTNFEYIPYILCLNDYPKIHRQVGK